MQRYFYSYKCTLIRNANESLSLTNLTKCLLETRLHEIPIHFTTCCFWCRQWCVRLIFFLLSNSWDNLWHLFESSLCQVSLLSKTRSQWCCYINNFIFYSDCMAIQTYLTYVTKKLIKTYNNQFYLWQYSNKVHSVLKVISFQKIVYH